MKSDKIKLSISLEYALIQKLEDFGFNKSKLINKLIIEYAKLNPKKETSDKSLSYFKQYLQLDGKKKNR